MDAQNLEGKPVLSRQFGSEAALNEEVSAGPGERVYTEYDYPVQEAARILDDTKYGKRIAFSKGQVLYGFFNDKVAGERWYCTTQEVRSWVTGPIDVALCLSGPTHTMQFTRIKPIGVGAIAKSAKPVVAYEPLTVSVPAEYAATWEGNFYRKEIVYQGARGGMLRLLYREYVNDLAREAFSQEIVLDLAVDGPTIAVVKSARLEVISAGNEGVTYRILEGFE